MIPPISTTQFELTFFFKKNKNNNCILKTCLKSKNYMSKAQPTWQHPQIIIPKSAVIVIQNLEFFSS
jgi:hypothetical protein